MPENFFSLPFFGVAPVQLASQCLWKGLWGLSLLLGGMLVGTLGENLTCNGVKGVGTFSLFDDEEEDDIV